jgi:hypothetical protein
MLRSSDCAFKFKEIAIKKLIKKTKDLNRALANCLSDSRNCHQHTRSFILYLFSCRGWHHLDVTMTSSKPRTQHTSVPHTSPARLWASLWRCHPGPTCRLLCPRPHAWTDSRELRAVTTDRASRPPKSQSGLCSNIKPGFPPPLHILSARRHRRSPGRFFHELLQYRPPSRMVLSAQHLLHRHGVWALRFGLLWSLLPWCELQFQAPL